MDHINQIAVANIAKIWQCEQNTLLLQNKNLQDSCKWGCLKGRLAHIIMQRREGFPKWPYSSQCYLFVPSPN